MTKQAIAIASKIAEIDALLADAPSRRDWVVEVHPELSFLALAKSLPSVFAAGFPSKKRTPGYTIRKGLIEEALPCAKDQLAAPPWLRRAAARDDPLDAYVALWSAHRHHHGVSETLGGHERDERGLLQRMIV